MKKWVNGLRKNPIEKLIKIEKNELLNNKINEKIKEKVSFDNIFVRKLIVGLGNPGKRYEGTRHNIGNELVHNFGSSYLHLKEKWENISIGKLLRHESMVFDKNPNDKDLIDKISQRRYEKSINKNGILYPKINLNLLLPNTYMNASGMAVKKFKNDNNWKLKNNSLAINRHDEILIIYDDLSIPFGTVKFKPKGSDGGQNGLKSVLKTLNTEKIGRVKVGIGAKHWFHNNGTGAPTGLDIADYVLQRFNLHEQDEMKQLQNYFNELLRVYIHRGLAEAASICNKTNMYEYKLH